MHFIVDNPMENCQKGRIVTGYDCMKLIVVNNS